MGKTASFLDYLVNATSTFLQSFELTHLNFSSNIRKTLAQVLADYVQEEARAQIARWITDYKNSYIPGYPSHSPELLPVQSFASCAPYSATSDTVVSHCSSRSRSIGRLQSKICTASRVHIQGRSSAPIHAASSASNCTNEYAGMRRKALIASKERRRTTKLLLHRFS